MKKIISIISIAAFMLLGARMFAATTTVVTVKRAGTDSVDIRFTKNTADTLSVKFLYCTNDSFVGIVLTYNYGVMRGAAGTYNTRTILSPGTVYYMKIVAYDSATAMYDTSNVKKMVRPNDIMHMILPDMDGFTMSSITDPGNDTVTVTHIVSRYSSFSLTYTLPHIATITGTTPVTTYDTSHGWGSGDTLYVRSIAHMVNGYFPDDTVTTMIVTGSPTPPPMVNLYGYISSTDTSIDVPVVMNIFGSPTGMARAYFRPTVGGVWTDSITFTLIGGIVGPQYNTFHYRATIPAHTYYIDVKIVDTGAIPGYLGTTSYATLPTPPRHLLRDSVVRYDTTTATFVLTQKYSNMLGHTSTIMSARIYGSGIVSTVPHFVSGADTIMTAFPISTLDTGLHGFFGWSTDDYTSLTVRSDTMWVRIYAEPAHTFGADSATKMYNTADTIRWTSTNAANVWIGTTPVANNGKLPVIIRRDTTIYYKVRGFNGTILFDSVFIHADSSALDTVLVTTGIEMISVNTISVYPNPALDEVIVQSLLPMHKIELYDIAGRLIQTCAPTGTEQKINVGNFENGIYLLVIHDKNNFTENRRLVIQH